MPAGTALGQRSPGDLAYYLCLMPHGVSPGQVPLQRLAEVAGARFTIKQCFEEGKGEAGLDQYEVRYWHSWYRHITLAMMALAWLASLRLWPEEKKEAAALAELSVAEVRRLLEVALPLPAESAEFKLAWSCWRHARRLQARQSHYRARVRQGQQMQYADSS